MCLIICGRSPANRITMPALVCSGVCQLQALEVTGSKKSLRAS